MYCTIHTDVMTLEGRLALAKENEWAVSLGRRALTVEEFIENQDQYLNDFYRKKYPHASREELLELARQKLADWQASQS